jgi:threonine synthase
MTVLRCQGCGSVLPGSARSFRCLNTGDGGDHVIGRTLDEGARYPEGLADRPFIHYRTLTHAYAVARAGGISDEDFVRLVEDLDRRVAGVAGHGFLATPLERSGRLSEAIGLMPPGGVWVKDETGNVGGSHKARHLMGLAILAEVEGRLGSASRTRTTGERLAIASCGNAALAASVIAKAAGKPVDVFIPTDADPRVIEALERYGATAHVCTRQAGAKGDPCFLAFREAVKSGAVPFCCQGSENGLTIEGGETLAWEVISDLARRGAKLDRLFVQVGGGALASACIAGFRDATSLGVPVSMPRIHPVQTRGAFPLRRAWERVVSRIGERLEVDVGDGDQRVAERLLKLAGSPIVAEGLDYAARHRSEFMWPWETAPRSVAHGILDDETYDWLAIVRAMIESGGFPIIVGEPRLVEANTLGRESTGIEVDETGTAGLAGLLELSLRGELSPEESALVLFTGVRR